MVGIVDETGYGRFVEVDEVELSFSGYVLAPTAIVPAGNNFAAAYNAVSVSGQSGYSATMQGSIASRSAMTITLSVPQPRTFKLNFKSDYNSAASLPALQGSWTFSYGATTIERANGELTFDSAGAITGSDSAGCIYSGSLSIDNPAFNAYRVSMNSSCLATPLTGLAALLAPAQAGLNKTVLFIVNNETRGFGLYLQPAAVSQ